MPSACYRLTKEALALGRGPGWRELQAPPSLHAKLLLGGPQAYTPRGRLSGARGTLIVRKPPDPPWAFLAIGLEISRGVSQTSTVA